MPHRIDATAYGARRHLARLFGVRQVSDIHERLGDLGLPMPIGRKRRERLELIARAGVLFIHVPKNAGTSISAALYGRDIKHGSIRFYQRAAPQLLAALPSFAVIRDPVDRFLSAYMFARNGGSWQKPISLAFRDTCMGLASIDAALDHVEAAASPYMIDNVFRPQSWFVTDREGRLAVDRLLSFDEVGRGPTVPGLPTFTLPCLNRGRGRKPAIGAAQIDRLRRIYAADFTLYDEVRRGLAGVPIGLPAKGAMPRLG